MEGKQLLLPVRLHNVHNILPGLRLCEDQLYIGRTGSKQNLLYCCRRAGNYHCSFAYYAGSYKQLKRKLVIK